MKKIHQAILFAILSVSILAGCSGPNDRQDLNQNVTQLPPKQEFRGSWIHTVQQSEYAQMTPEVMRRSFIGKLNTLKACGINAIIFQVRPEADAWYPSKLEPWSRFLTGKQGKAPEPLWDPMKFMIEECHNRNMEFHAWLNPYRVKASDDFKLAPEHVYYQHPEWFLKYGKQTFFDPGLPACRTFITQVVRDIVTRYDVDAIHMDDYFYPYPIKGEEFPDDSSFKKYGIPKGYTAETKGDWRRENVNLLIKNIKNAISQTKPWVRFGISPFGIYRNKASTPDGFGSDTKGLQNYDALYADVIKWLREDWIDYNMPQIYWNIGFKIADYEVLSAWWNTNAFNAHLYVGQNVVQTMKGEQLDVKIKSTRAHEHISGSCFWPANELLKNNSGITDSLATNYHRYPALIPPYTNMNRTVPQPVARIKEGNVDGQPALLWDAPAAQNDKGEQAHYYVVYRVAKGQTLNLNDPRLIQAITRQTSYILPHKKKDGATRKYAYYVTAVNRYNTESEPSRSIKVKL